MFVKDNQYFLKHLFTLVSGEWGNGTNMMKVWHCTNIFIFQAS